MLTSGFKSWEVKFAILATFMQDAAWFDEPQHNTGSLSNVLATDASNVQGVCTIVPLTPDYIRGAYWDIADESFM